MLSVGITYSVVLPHTSCQHNTFVTQTRVNISTVVTVPVTVTESTVHSNASTYTRRFDSGKLSKNENSNLHGFEIHRPSSKGTKSLFQVIKAITNQSHTRNGSFIKSPIASEK